MASNLGNKVKKLYFDANLTATITNQSFLCTQFTAGTPGDRYGALMQAMEACTGSTQSGMKQRRAVSAWFQPSRIVAANATTPLNILMGVRFVQPTSNGTNKAALTGLPYLTVGGGAVAEKIGQEAIYGTAGSLRHFAIQVQKLRSLSGGAITVAGVLYVQRQHTIEV